jgi:AcrR family transcriptional regulator
MPGGFVTADGRAEDVRQTAADRGAATRDRILDAAERLFAERGLLATSNRQIGEAAGQGNNSVVGYHFGGRSELVLAVLRRHTAAVERLRGDLLAELRPESPLRDRVECMVRPLPAHLATLGGRTWHARFLAQAGTEPSLREVVRADAEASPTVGQALDGMVRLLPALPPGVRAERAEMSRQLVVHMCAERERSLHDGNAPAQQAWESTTAGLIDALVGLWLAPVTPTACPDPAWRNTPGGSGVK